jgi:hypothetical protein
MGYELGFEGGSGCFLVGKIFRCDPSRLPSLTPSRKQRPRLSTLPSNKVDQEELLRVAAEELGTIIPSFLIGNQCITWLRVGKVYINGIDRSHTLQNRFVELRSQFWSRIVQSLLHGVQMAFYLIYQIESLW